MINNSKPTKDLNATTEESLKFSIDHIKKFINEVKAEASKIVWPERKVTMGLTTVVIVLSLVASLYLGVVDIMLGKIVSSFLN